MTLVPDLPFYIEALAGIFNGDNETAFRTHHPAASLATGRIRTFFELGDEHAIELGMSVASGMTDDRNRSTILDWEVRYKYRPDGGSNPLVTFTGEALLLVAHGQRRRRRRRRWLRRSGRQASAQSFRLVCRPRGAALPPVGRRLSLRLVGVSDQIRAGSGPSSRTSRSGRPNSSASGWPTSTPSAVRKPATPST